MKVLRSWLNEFTPISLSDEDLDHLLTMAGLEVESITPIGHELCNVVTAKIQEISPHPNADKLVITQVFDGSATHQIVTGASNISEGDIVPLSLPGAVLQGGLKIKPSKLRGVESNGMLCSETELGVSDESEGIWILPSDTVLGQDFIELAGLKDSLIDIAILPNQGHCQSVYGIARELSAILGTELKPLDSTDPLTEKKTTTSKTKLKISIFNDRACSQYNARIIEGINRIDTPLWMARRLELSDIRPISFIVDVTNYVLLETGQPLHAFDLEKLQGKEIQVRQAKKGERILTLDEKDVTLSEQTLIIADAKAPVAIAGIMGGKDLEVDDKTQNIVLEAAYFEPATVRAAELRHGIRTESAARFEKGIDWKAVSHAAHRAARLILDIAGAESVSEIQQIANQNAAPSPKAIPLDIKEINEFLGTDFSQDYAEATLNTLGYTIEENTATPPSWRERDVQIWQNLAEELARIQGYDKIPSTLPLGTNPIQAKGDRGVAEAEKAADRAISLGYHQVITFPMISPKDMDLIQHPITEQTPQIQNPISSEEAIMRPSLIPGLLNRSKYNSHRQESCIKLFEIGNVFADDETETLHMALLETGTAIPDPYLSEDQSKQKDFFTIKGKAERLLAQLGIKETEASRLDSPIYHPGQSAVLLYDEIEVARLGLIHPQILQDLKLTDPIACIELNLSTITAIETASAKASPIPAFPGTSRDIAILAEKSIAYKDIQLVLNKNKPKICKKITLFDHFESEKIGNDKKSVAVRLFYQDPEKTLSDEEVNSAHQALVQALTEALPISIR